jgi:hypothetical protein
MRVRRWAMRLSRSAPRLKTQLAPIFLKGGEPDLPAQWLDRDFAADLDDSIVRQFEPVTEALQVAA